MSDAASCRQPVPNSSPKVAARGSAGSRVMRVPFSDSVSSRRAANARSPGPAGQSARGGRRDVTGFRCFPVNPTVPLANDCTVLVVVDGLPAVGAGPAPRFRAKAAKSSQPG